MASKERAPSKPNKLPSVLVPETNTDRALLVERLRPTTSSGCSHQSEEGSQPVAKDNEENKPREGRLRGED